MGGMGGGGQGGGKGGGGAKGGWDLGVFGRKMLTAAYCESFTAGF